MCALFKSVAGVPMEVLIERDTSRGTTLRLTVPLNTSKDDE